MISPQCTRQLQYGVASTAMEGPIHSLNMVRDIRHRQPEERTNDLTLPQTLSMTQLDSRYHVQTVQRRRSSSSTMKYDHHHHQPHHQRQNVLTTPDLLNQSHSDQYTVLYLNRPHCIGDRWTATCLHRRVQPCLTIPCWAIQEGQCPTIPYPGEHTMDEPLWLHEEA